MRSTTLIPAALLAASTLASPLRRNLGSDGVMTDMEVVTDIVYVTYGASEPFSTSLCSEEARATTTPSSILAPTTAAAISSAPYGTANHTTPHATGTGAPLTTTPALLPTLAPGVPACPQPLTVGMDGQPILIAMLGGATLTGCTFTSTVTSNPATLLSDSAIIASTTALSGAGTGSTALFQAYSTAVSSAAVTTTLSAAAGGAGGEEAATTVTSASVHALFTTPSAFASMASTLTKITAAPTFGAELTGLSVLATASLSLPAAQSSAVGSIY